MNPQSTAYLRWTDGMDTEIFDHGRTRRVRGSARHPIAPRCGTLVALRLPRRDPRGDRRHAGICPPRRCALPAHRIAAHSGTFN